MKGDEARGGEKRTPGEKVLKDPRSTTRTGSYGDQRERDAPHLFHVRHQPRVLFELHAKRVPDGRARVVAQMREHERVERRRGFAKEKRPAAVHQASFQRGVRVADAARHPLLAALPKRSPR